MKLDPGQITVDGDTARSIVDVIAATIGFTPPTDGLIGSGLSRMMAYQRARDICNALGLPHELDAEVLRRWGKGEVIHLGPRQA